MAAIAGTPGVPPAPIPGVAGYAGAAALATRAYNNTLAQLNQQRQAALQSYGYLGSIDPTSGTITNVRVDPMNPFGQLQTMLRSQAQEDQTARYASQDRGLVGGLANQQLSDLHYQHGGQSAQLGTTFANQLADFQNQQTGAAYTRDEALWNAEQLAAEQAIQNQDFTPANPNDPSAGPAPDTTSTVGSGSTSTPLTNGVPGTVNRLAGARSSVGAGNTTHSTAIKKLLKILTQGNTTKGRMPT